MARDWIAEFKDLNERERSAFRRLGAALYKVTGKTTPAVIDEMETANKEWQTAKKALTEFIEEFRSQQ